MPKIYSEVQKKKIKESLKAAAANSMKENGIKKTTVDALVQAAGIPKGTFYLFYQSKEMLLFDVCLDIHEKMEQAMFKELAKLQGNLNAETLTDFIFKYFKMVNETCIVRLMDPTEMALLSSKLPPEIMAEHLVHDTDNVADILKLLLPKKSIDQTAVSCAFRGAFMMLLYQKEMGTEVFDKSLRIIIRGIVLQLF